MHLITAEANAERHQEAPCMRMHILILIITAFQIQVCWQLRMSTQTR